MKLRHLAVLILAAVFMAMAAGCASMQTSAAYKESFTRPEEAYSVPDAVEIQKQIKAGKITRLVVRLNDGLLLEDSGTSGMWPAKALLPNGSYADGFLTGNMRDNMDEWGSFTFWGFIYAGERELDSAKILYFSRLGKKCFTPTGRSIDDFNPGKYKGDEAYRKELFIKYGKTPREIEDFWRDYFVFNAAQLDSGAKFVQEMSLQEYKSFLDSVMTSFPKTLGGEVRATSASLADYKKVATQNPGTTFWERYKDNFRPRFAVDPASAAAMILAPAMEAYFNEFPKGFYLNAQVTREQLMYIPEELCRQYRTLLRQHAEASRMKDERLISELQRLGVSDSKLAEAMRRASQ